MPRRDADALMVLAIVLAAGRSSRMGRLKPLLPLHGGETCVSRLVRVLREGGADDVLIVLGHQAGAIRAAIDAHRLPAHVVENPAYDAGQLSSLLAALSLADRPGVAAVLVAPVDMPFVSAATVRTVIDTYRRTGAPIVRPAWQGLHGHPVLFDRRLFVELRQTNPSAGARAVVRAHAGDSVDVTVEDEGAFVDIDTPADYEEALRRFAD